MQGITDGVIYPYQTKTIFKMQYIRKKLQLHLSFLAASFQM